LSARELAEQAGYGLTRGVIANIESGRKTDITVNQLIALSVTLGVPPVVLALPIDEPYALVAMAAGDSDDGATTVHKYLRSFMAIDWFQGDPKVTFKMYITDATQIAEAMLRSARLYPRIERDLMKARHRLERGETTQEQVDELEAELEREGRTLRQLGIDPTAFEIDE